MDFVALVDQVVTLLRQRSRVTYCTLQRQLQLDEDALADLLAELRYAYRDEILEARAGRVVRRRIGRPNGEISDPQAAHRTHNRCPYTSQNFAVRC